MTFKGFDKDFNITDKVAVVTGQQAGLVKQWQNFFPKRALMLST